MQLVLTGFRPRWRPLASPLAFLCIVSFLFLWCLLHNEVINGGTGFQVAFLEHDIGAAGAEECVFQWVLTFTLLCVQTGSLVHYSLIMHSLCNANAFPRSKMPTTLSCTCHLCNPPSNVSSASACDSAVGASLGFGVLLLSGACCAVVTSLKGMHWIF